MDQIILDALAGRKVLKFMYNGLQRVCEPHVLGIANGVPQVLCYQLDGKSSRGGIPAWRRFDLASIGELETTAETFPGVRSIPQGPHTVWDTIVQVVE